MSGGVRLLNLWRWLVRLLLLLRNSSATASAGLLQFRMITFGLYEPHWLYGWRCPTHPTWQVNPRVLGILLRRLPAYVGWLEELEAIKRDGPAGYWKLQQGEAGYAHFQKWLVCANASEEI